VSLEELVTADHRVRLAWRFVEGLDLWPLYDRIEAIEEHPPAELRILIALCLHATLERLGSARAMARLCAEHIAFQWLCGGVGMIAKTLADLRVVHGAGLEHLLVDSFAALLQKALAVTEALLHAQSQARAH
jgi:transposase